MDRRLWRRWTALVTLGELAGFVAPAIAGATLTAFETSAALTLAVMLAAGAVEGFFLGYAQAWALRIPRRGLAWATAAAAVVAYAAGMTPSLLGERALRLRTEE